MSFFLKMFLTSNESFYITEFGHSEHKRPKTVGPWSREIYILHFITKGYADFSGFRAETGEAFLIAKERLHSFTTSEDYEHYWIGFDGNKIDTLFGAFGLKHKDHQLFFIENFDFAKTLFLSVNKMLQSRDQDLEESLARSLLLSMLPLLKTQKQSKASLKIDYAEKALMYIKRNYMYPLKMTDVARNLYISEKYMYHLFVERFNISPKRFLVKTRMEAARDLLQKSNLSVTETASAVGYASVFVFSKTFSNYFGISPSSCKK